LDYLVLLLQRYVVSFHHTSKIARVCKLHNQINPGTLWLVAESINLTGRNCLLVAMGGAFEYKSTAKKYMDRFSIIFRPYVQNAQF
jgi:hypothetical protein